MAFFSGLYHRFRHAFDPNRLAMSQAFLAGDHGAAAEQFGQLQAEHERLRMWDRRKRKAAEALKAEEMGAPGATAHKLGSDAGPISHPFQPGSGAGQVAEIFGSAGDGAGYGAHVGLQDGAASYPAFRFASGTDVAARTAASEDEPYVDATEGRPFAEGLPRTRGDRVFPAAISNLGQERGAKLRARQRARDAQEHSVRGTAEAGVSARVPAPSLVEVITAPAIQQARNAVRNTIPPGGDGRIGNSYADPDYLPIETALEREYGLPAGILSAIRTRGERSNADQVSEFGARTVYQITPSSRRRFMRAYGIDAWAGPEQAARVAALHLRESHERHRDWNRAILEYHGGPDRRNWRHRTRAYGERVGDFSGRR